MGQEIVLRKRLKDCRSVWETGRWCQAKGFSPGEHKDFGGVHPGHTRGATSSPTDDSLHYQRIVDGRIQKAPDDQGTLAFDINDRDVADDVLPFDDETEALIWLYHKFLGALGPKGRDVLDEMFFDGFGFIKETPTDNHPIGGHDGHMHAGFKQERW
ncbi:MAG: hypothetical protein M3323_07205 [Actinomycetota bacterium]|nr:hypothetical protein [Actinomycetota bacterium]